MPQKKKKKKIEVDFSDEESVAAAMASELDVDVDDIKIKSSHLESFRTGTLWEISVGRTEYIVAENSDAADDLAKAVVAQDLEHEPGIFNQDFIERHIDKDRLRNDLHSDVWDMRYESLKEEADRRPMEFLKDNNIDIPEPTEKQLREHAEAMSDDENSAQSIYDKLKEMGDPEDRWIEMGNDPEVPDSEIETIATAETDEALKDPVGYLEEIYGREDSVKKAIEIAGIDIDEAAEDAVKEDGAEHFLARYDGAINDGPGGIVYWREN